MKKIKIFSKIREKVPDFGDLQNVYLEIDLSEHCAKNHDTKNAVRELYDTLLSKLENGKVLKNEKFELYCIAPNSILVSISYILTKLGYNFCFYPKPTDSKIWGWDNHDIKDSELSNFINNRSAQIEIRRHEKACVILSGKFDISEVDTVEQGNENLIINKDSIKNGKNIIRVSHYLKLEECSYKSLSNKIYYDKFEENITKMFDELSSFESLNEAHIISSIPANGLLCIGKIIADKKYDYLKFYIYSYDKDNTYKLGNILYNNLLK